MTIAWLSEKMWMSMSEPVSDVSGPDAADQPGAEPGELAHEAEGLEPHVAEVVEPLRPFVDPGHRLDLVADLGVRRQVGRPESIFDPELLGGLAFGGEVLGLGPMIHELRGEKGDLPPDAFVSHETKMRRLGPSKRRRAEPPTPPEPPAGKRLQRDEMTVA